MMAGKLHLMAGYFDAIGIEITPQDGRGKEGGKRETLLNARETIM